MDKIFKPKDKFKPLFYKKNGATVMMWGYEPSFKEGSELPYGYCYQKTFSYRLPKEDAIKFINEFYNEETCGKILSGMTYNGKMVWLSQENQLNYQSMFNLAAQTNGGNLPERVKVGTDDDPSYITFESIEDVTDFYMAVHKHIQTCLDEGREKKTNIANEWKDGE